MRIADMHWQAVEAYLRRDDRCILPTGCTEQHAYLSLATDSILAERVALAAAEPLGVPVFPALPYGMTPTFRAFPGTVSIRIQTYLALIRDLLDSLTESGFRRILIVNGHGGNMPMSGLIAEWCGDHPDVQVQVHNWWAGPKLWAAIQALDPVASHASWMENFAWTRLPDVTMPEVQKPMVDVTALRMQNPAGVRQMLGDGNYGGYYQRSDSEMAALWEVAVAETRSLLESGWRG
jgi:creatinine amidohydrolase